MTASAGIGAVVAAAVGYLLVRHYLSAYLAEKGKNLATKEDVAGITREIESVRNEYVMLVEQFKANHQLRIAAIDQRLKAHQKAFTLWWDLIHDGASDAHDDAKVKACSDFWAENCLYLEPEVRAAFRHAYSSMFPHQQLQKRTGYLVDSEEVTNSWAEIMKAGDVILKAVQLPGLTQEERPSIPGALTASEQP